MKPMCWSPLLKSGTVFLVIGNTATTFKRWPCSFWTKFTCWAKTVVRSSKWLSRVWTILRRRPTLRSEWWVSPQPWPTARMWPIGSARIILISTTLDRKCDLVLSKSILMAFQRRITVLEWRRWINQPSMPSKNSVTIKPPWFLWVPEGKPGWPPKVNLIFRNDFLACSG